MTDTSSNNAGENAADLDNTSDKPRRTLVLKVWVNSAEKAKIARQKARMSFSAFLRDRGINQGEVFDPTYAAIGSVYQSARNLRNSAAHLENASMALQNFAAVLAGRGSSADPDESIQIPCEELRKLASSLEARAERIENQAGELGDQARELGREHMNQMLKRYPAKAIKPRDRG